MSTMARTIVIPLLLALLCACGQNAETTFAVTLDLQFDPAEAADCTTYLAKNFAVTIYTDDFKTAVAREFPCPIGEQGTTVELAAGDYFLTVALKDAGGAVKSWGSAQFTVAQAMTLPVALAEYRGGITLLWPASLCDNFDIAHFTVTARSEDAPVSAVVWGAEQEITDLVVPCSAKQFQIQNVAAGLYELAVNGYRSADAPRPRAGSTIPSFKVTTGQDSAIPLADYLEITVSDLFLTWEFDSKSISSCDDAAVTTVRGTATLDGTDLSEEAACDLSGARTFRFYDIPAGDYTLAVEGLDATGKTTYAGDASLAVEQGRVGADAYAVTIYLKQE